MDCGEKFHVKHYKNMDVYFTIKIMFHVKQ